MCFSISQAQFQLNSKRNQTTCKHFFFCRKIWISKCFAKPYNVSNTLNLSLEQFLCYLNDDFQLKHIAIVCWNWLLNEALCSYFVQREISQLVIPFTFFFLRNKSLIIGFDWVNLLEPFGNRKKCVMTDSHRFFNINRRPNQWFIDKDCMKNVRL